MRQPSSFPQFQRLKTNFSLTAVLSQDPSLRLPTLGRSTILPSLRTSIRGKPAGSHNHLICNHPICNHPAYNTASWKPPHPAPAPLRFPLPPLLSPPFSRRVMIFCFQFGIRLFQSHVIKARPRLRPVIHPGSAIFPGTSISPTFILFYISCFLFFLIAFE